MNLGRYPDRVRFYDFRSPWQKQGIWAFRVERQAFVDGQIAPAALKKASARDDDQRILRPIQDAHECAWIDANDDT